jgi:transcriptional regulator GlxA family with amidase domain
MSPECLDVVIILMFACPRRFAIGSLPQRLAASHCRDPQIAVALKSMHEKVDALRTVETLTATCGMTRFAFALRFKELVGETPLEYLTSWRMQKAAALLQKGGRTLIDVARAVGLRLLRCVQQGSSCGH